MFGSSWASQYPTEHLVALAKKEWASGLSDVELPQIKLAFDRIKRSGSSFPPSLPKFLSYCKADADWEHRGQAYKLHQRALPKPVNRTAGRAALQGLKAAL